MKVSTAQRKAIAKLANLEWCRREFWHYCQHMDPGFFTEDKPHLKQIADALQEVAEGKIKKLAISEAPRAGKSYELTMWVSWMIGKFPEDSFMRNSYAADLAEKFSYDTRQILLSPKYKEIFPNIKLKQDKKSVSDWAVQGAKQSTYFCAGVGGPILGKGVSRAAILDDPFKNIEEALSETVLESKWNWYTSTHLSRLESGCAEIHVATRWSRRDIIGRLVDEWPDDWTVIVIPALDENGESFCPAIKTTKELLDIKKITEDFIWEAEYMQNPIESKGLLYPVEELKRFRLDEVKDRAADAILGFTDTADQGEDSFCTLIGKKIGEYTYWTDAIFTQDPVEITEPLLAGLIVDTKCELMQIESNNGGRLFANNVRKLVKDRGSHCIVASKYTTQNKETRILLNSGYVKEYFYFRNDYPSGSDYDKFMRQLTGYVKLGKNKHDEAPDVVTMAGEYIRDLPAAKPKAKKPVANFSWEKKTQYNKMTGGRITKSYMNFR